MHKTLEKVLLEPIFMFTVKQFTHFGSIFESHSRRFDFSATSLDHVRCFSSRKMSRKQELVIHWGQLVSLFAVHRWVKGLSPAPASWAVPRAKTYEKTSNLRPAQTRGSDLTSGLTMLSAEDVALTSLAVGKIIKRV